MKAIVINEFGDQSVLRFQEVQKPVPGDTEVLIKVAYAGVNPVDWKIREGYLKDMLPHDFPIILGWDVSGTVAQVGKAVTNLQIGDEVISYVRKPVVKWGAYAEYVTFETRVATYSQGSTSLDDHLKRLAPRQGLVTLGSSQDAPPDSPNIVAPL